MSQVDQNDPSDLKLQIKIYKDRAYLLQKMDKTVTISSDNSQTTNITAGDIRREQKISHGNYLNEIVPKIEKLLLEVKNQHAVPLPEYIEIALIEDSQNFKEVLISMYIKRGFTVSFPRAYGVTMCRLSW